MSFYIGFVTKDLVVLAVDRKHWDNDNGKFVEMGKLKAINKDIWGVHIGWKFFSEAWIENITLLNHQFNIKPSENLIKGLRLVMWWDYRRWQKRMKKRQQEIRGFTNIAIGGFVKGKPFICAMDSKDKFKPLFCREGSIYSCIEKDEGDIDRYIKNITQELGRARGDSIEEQKGLLKDGITGIIRVLSERYECISRSGDIVFITREGAVKTML